MLGFCINTYKGWRVYRTNAGSFYARNGGAMIHPQPSLEALRQAIDRHPKTLRANGGTPCCLNSLVG